MKKRLPFWFVTGGVLACVAVALALEWRHWLDLQAEVAAARGRVADGALIRVENERLRQIQVSDEELARLRADHAALPRLRAELEVLGSAVRAGEPTVPR